MHEVKHTAVINQIGIGVGSTLLFGLKTGIRPVFSIYYAGSLVTTYRIISTYISCIKAFIFFTYLCEKNSHLQSYSSLTQVTVVYHLGYSDSGNV